MSDDESGSDCSEPLFKYSRCTGFPRTFFNKDPVSAALVGPNLVALGTHSGVLHLAASDLSPIRTTRIHRASILDIKSIGPYVFTSSIDGTVVVSSVHDPQDVHGSDTKRPVNAVAPSPEYSSTHSYLSGGTSGQISLNSRGWIMARSEQVVDESNSAILALEWRDTRAVWCTQREVVIWDSVGQSVLARFKVRVDLHKPRIHVAESSTVIAFGKKLLFLDLNGAQLVRTLTLPWIVAGVAYFDDTHLLLLCTQPGEPAELRLVDLDGVETYVDELGMQGYERLKPNDYTLQGSNDKWYIISANDAVLAQLRDQRDHLEWLLEQGEVLEAFTASAGVLDTEQRIDLGLEAAESLFDQARYTECAQILYEIDISAQQWKDWAQKFINAKQFAAIGPVLPDFNLGNAHTDIVLWCAANDKQLLAELLGKWDPALLDKSKIIITLEKLGILDVLGSFYLVLSEPYNAAKCFLELNDQRAYTLVEQYHLWNDMLPELPQILQLAPSLEGLLESKVAPHKVVNSLQDGPILHKYLKELAKLDPFLVKDFGDLQVRLYAEHEPDKLHQFLNSNSSYNLSESIKVCEKFKLTNSLIFLYGRVGQTSKALNLIIQSGDPEAAIHFAASHNDAELWHSLIDYSKDKPAYVLCLLQCPEVPPTIVLEAVPRTLKIPGLRDALRKLLASQNSTLILNNGALSIVRAEAKAHFDVLQRLRKRGQTWDVGSTDWLEPQLVGGPESVPEPLEKLAQQPHEPWLTFKIRHLVEALRYLN